MPAFVCHLQPQEVYISLLLYVYNHETFTQLEEKKSTELKHFLVISLIGIYQRLIEQQKRILYRKEYNIFNPSKHTEIFE